MRLMRLWLLATMFLFLSVMAAWAADITADSCSSADVQTAIDSTVDGDRVLVPAGSCTWSVKVTIPDTKGITLQGAGIGQTIITDNLTTDDLLRISVDSGNSLTDVNSITFDQNAVVKTGINGTIVFDGSGLDSFRIHHFEILNLWSRGVVYDGGITAGSEISGLMDNCTIEMPNDTPASPQTFSLVADLTGGARNNFARGFELGSNKFLFIEDCTFEHDFPGDGVVDAFSGARYVFRYNTVNGAVMGHHGADSGTRSGIHSFEIYGNTFDNQNANIARAFLFRSG